MKENGKNDPVGFNTKTDPKKEQDPINKGSKNNDTENHAEVLDEENGDISNPEKNREHDDTDHEHDYKNPGDDPNKNKEQSKDQVDQRPNQTIDKTTSNQNSSNQGINTNNK